MEIFDRFFHFVGEVPDLIPLIILPSVQLIAMLLYFFLHRRDLSRPTFFAIAGCGFLFMSAKGDVTLAFFWLGLLFLEYALCSLLFLIKRKDKKQSKADTMYQRFHVPLTDEGAAQREARPPKITCFSDEKHRAEACGLQFQHVDALLGKLKKTELSAGDRLEMDALCRRVEGYRGRELSQDELDVLNDCLASVLKLTAKYCL